MLKSSNNETISHNSFNFAIGADVNKNGIVFKTNQLKNCFNVVWIVFGILLLFDWLPLNLFSGWLAAVFGSALILFGVLNGFWHLMHPYLVIREEGIAYYPYPFIIKKFFAFKHIKNVHFINPEYSVTFQMHDGESKSINIAPLSKKDRIRSIFLIESDINRKHI